MTPTPEPPADRVVRVLADVTAAATDHERALTARDRAIRAAHDAGATLRDVAAAAGLSNAGVSKIAERVAAEDRAAAEVPTGG